MNITYNNLEFIVGMSLLFFGLLLTFLAAQLIIIKGAAMFAVLMFLFISGVLLYSVKLLMD